MAQNLINVLYDGSPQTTFDENITAGYAPLVVAFYDESGNVPSSWNWSFGDGNYSTSQNPIYTYASAGTYTVALNATNSLGSNTFTKSGLIFVKPTIYYWERIS